MTAPLPKRFATAMGHLLGPEFPAHLALAVSGGGDSMALLALAHNWAHPMGVGLWVVSVDHGLRPESAAEAALVAKECAALGHPHATLRWQWNGTGNLQDAARRARLTLIDRWRGGIDHVLFAHTQDDVAETCLMRLLRGSGVEGLAAMEAARDVQILLDPQASPEPCSITQTGSPPPAPMGETRAGFHLIRPLLTATRAELRHHIETLKVPYIDDPSNEDPRFDRARMRKAIADLGLSTGALAETAARLARARAALEARAADVARRIVTQDTVEGRDTGDLLFDRDAFARIERDTQLRILAGALQWVSSDPYRPRVAPLEALLDQALSGRGGTLHGARLFVEGAALRIAREYNAVKDLTAQPGDAAIWDRRWQISTSEAAGATLRALGPDGLAQLPEIPAGHPPRAALMAQPALFEGTRLMACALITLGPKFDARLRPQRGSFVASLESR